MAHQPLGGRPVEVVRGSNEPFPTADLKARIRERHSFVEQKLLTAIIDQRNCS